MANSRTKADARHRVNACTHRSSCPYIDIKIKARSLVVVADSVFGKKEEREKDQAKDVSQSMYGFWFSFCLASWSFLDDAFSHPPRCSEMKSWPNLWCGSEVYIFIYILSYGLSAARAATTSSIISILNFFLLFSISRALRAKSMKFYFCCEKLHWKNGRFSKNRAFCPLASHTQPHRVDRAYTFANSHHPPLCIISIFMYWIGWVFCSFVRFSSCQACLEPCDPLISMKHTKSINWIPYDDNVGWMGFVKRTIRDPMVKRNETKTGSLMFIDWWPCMHWAHRPTPNVHRRTVCRFFFFFSSRPELISRNRRREGKNPPNLVFFFKIPIHIVVSSSAIFCWLVGFFANVAWCT